MADFFAFAQPDNKPFSFAFDYTFYCALPPSMRKQWGARYAEVIRPGGILVCLAFPLGASRLSLPFLQRQPLYRVCTLIGMLSC